jgi:hypothetical protein
VHPALTLLVMAAGYKNPDDNPSWVDPVLIVGFVVVLIACVVGYFWFRAKLR